MLAGGATRNECNHRIFTPTRAAPWRGARMRSAAPRLLDQKVPSIAPCRGGSLGSGNPGISAVTPCLATFCRASSIPRDGAALRPMPSRLTRYGSRGRRLAPAASWMLSLRVGWAWMVFSISSTVSSLLIASPISAMSSVASLPMMWAPRISPCGSPIDQLDEAFGLADCQGFAARLERELADLVFEPLLLRSALSEADAGDLWLAIRATRERFRPSSAACR